MSQTSTSPLSTRPESRRLAGLGRAVRGAFLAAALLAIPLGAFAKEGAGDDFAFGRKLAEQRYFDFARQVYEEILAASDATNEEKAEARFGLASLSREAAISATGRADVPYEDVEKLFSGAVQEIADFAKKNPGNPFVPEAKLDVGVIRLAFVQWARELVLDEEEMTDRSATRSQIQKDAKKAVDEAIEYFGELRPSQTAIETTRLEELAEYYYVMSQYYRALVFPPGSDEAKQALEKAATEIDDYIMVHEGQLLAIYAYDIFGLIYWELAKAATDTDERKKLYGSAYEWFENCVYTENLGPDYLQVITSGYYHMGQASLEAGRIGDRDFPRDALAHLRDMLSKHPTAWRTENGLRAMVEWAKLECARGDAAAAINVAKDAADRAKTIGMGYMERVAGRQLTRFVKEGCGGEGTASAASRLDTEVLKRVADDLYVRQEYEQAIRAYQTVIASTAQTREGFLNFGWDCWAKLAACYRQLGDRLGEALALGPIHDAWIAGLIPHVPGDEDDENMKRAGNQRMAAAKALEEVAEATGSPVLAAQAKEILQALPAEYPDHSVSEAAEWNAALDLWRQAREMKNEGKTGWKAPLDEARQRFRNVAHDMKSPKQDAAWVFLVRIEVFADRFQEALKVGNEALKYWADPERVQQAEKSETVQRTRRNAKSQLLFWMGNALVDLERFPEALELLSGYHEEYPDATNQFKSLVYDYLVQSHIGVGDIEKAKTAYDTLLRLDPEYFNIAPLTVKLAGHYNEIRAAIEKELREAKIELAQTRPEFRAADREMNKLASLIADLSNAARKIREELAHNEGLKADPREEPRLGDREEEEMRKDLAEREKRIEAERARFEEVEANRNALEKKVQDLTAKVADLEQRIYEPLTRAAAFYKGLDDVQKAAESSKRNIDNVAIYGQMFWFAGTLRPEERKNWELARALLEDYLEHPRIKELPLTHPDKRGAISRLGEVYVRLAHLESDPKTRAEFVQRAVDRMQSSLAKNAEDNDLVVGLLTGDVLALQYTDRGSQVTYRFPIRRPATVADMRKAIQDVGTGSGIALPYEPNERKRGQREDVLSIFKRIAGAESDASLESLLKRAGFDPVFYRQLADASPEFMATLAWAYSKTGREEDAPKAVNLASSLVRGPIALDPDRDPELWWRAYNILADTYRQAAMRHLERDGVSSTEAQQYLARAGDLLKALGALYPDFGEDVIPGNGDRWEEYRLDLNQLRGRAGLAPVVIDKLVITGTTEGNGEDDGDANAPDGPR